MSKKAGRARRSQSADAKPSRDGDSAAAARRASKEARRKRDTISGSVPPKSRADAAGEDGAGGLGLSLSGTAVPRAEKRSRSTSTSHNKRWIQVRRKEDDDGPSLENLRNAAQFFTFASMKLEGDGGKKVLECER